MDDKRFALRLTEAGNIVLIGMLNLGNLGMGQRSIQGGLRCLSAKDGYIYVDTIRSIGDYASPKWNKE